MALGPTADRLPRQLQLRAGQGARPGITFSTACRRSKLAPTHIGSAAVAVVAWVITAARSRRSKRAARHACCWFVDMASAREGAGNPHHRWSLLIEPTAAVIVRTACLALYCGMRPATCPVPWSAGTVAVSRPRMRRASRPAPPRVSPADRAHRDVDWRASLLQADAWSVDTSTHCAII